MKKKTARGRYMFLTGMMTASLLLAACGMGNTSYSVDQLEEVSSSAGSEEMTADGAASASNAAGNGSAGNTSETGNGKISGTGSGSAGKAGLQADRVTPTPTPAMPAKEKISFDPTWEYADESKIHTDPVTLWHAKGTTRKDIVVAVNAGHGCSGGDTVQTYCHPDHTAKVTGGSTSSGATMATAINSGMTFNDGTKEAEAVLQLAKLVKEDLLKAGFDVLMIRDNDDTQLDNIARTVFANNCADCHISLHYDSTAGDKGFFYIRVPDNASYKAMEPVASNWEKHDALGEAILAGAEESGVRIFSGGSIALDLTQTSYSTVPSVDVEVGDKSSDHSEAAQKIVAEGITVGLEKYFRENPVKDGALARLTQKNGSLSGKNSESGSSRLTETDSESGSGRADENGGSEEEQAADE